MKTRSYALNTATKKISSFFLILLGFLPMLFMLVVLFQKKDIKRKMREELKHGELVTVVLPEKEVVWMDDHEIWVNNSMFDIASKKLDNGIYTFTGMYDEAETALVEKERDVAGEADEQNKLLSLLFKYLPNYCNESGLLTGIPGGPEDKGHHFIMSPVQQYRDILTPPPQAGFPL